MPGREDGWMFRETGSSGSDGMGESDGCGYGLYGRHRISGCGYGDAEGYGRGNERGGGGILLVYFKSTYPSIDAETLEMVRWKK